MPQFLKTRYNETVALIMAIFWLFLYVFVNLTSILFLGSLAINNLVGGSPASFEIIMIALSVFAVIITLGGMKVIGYTDVTQEQTAKLFIHNSELSGWPPHIPCASFVLPNDGSYDPNISPISVYEYVGLAIKSFNAAPVECVDCTLRGTNKRPPFWP